MDVTSALRTGSPRAVGSLSDAAAAGGLGDANVSDRPEKRSPGLSDGPVRRIGRRPRPPKLYRIGEVVEYSGISRQTVHNYTSMGLLSEVQWTGGGHRLYDESAFERLDEIADLKAKGMSLSEIRKHFKRIDAARR